MRGQWRHEKTNSVSGINGQPEETLGEVSIPLRLADGEGTYAADVLGGEVSLCPALLSNPSLRRQKAAILCDYFTNGDGVLVVSDGQDGWRYLRLLLTDSGHYLLPIDHVNKVSSSTRKSVEAQLYTWASGIQKQWQDVRHCFLAWQCPSPNREHDRSEVSSGTTSTTSLSTTSKENNDNQDTTLPKTPSTTSDGDPRTPCNFKVTSESANVTLSTTSSENNDNRDTTPKTPSTTSGPCVCSSFLDGPPGAAPVQDEWVTEGEFLVRRHRVPRRILFTPSCSIDCPVPAAQLSQERITEIRPYAKRTAPRILEDNWTTSAVPCRDLEYLWIGITKFKLAPVPVVSSTPSTSKMAAATDLVESSLDSQVFPHYGGDRFPSHWSEQRKLKTARHYKAIPEEFYTKTGRRPVTPENVKQWVHHCQGRGLRFQFWEWFSGSGRLSLFLTLAHVMVGFPVDFRYGWDVGHAPHQGLLRQCQEQFCPDHLFSAPSCTPWSVASANKDPRQRDLDRRLELPTLSFSARLRCVSTTAIGALQQPHSSDMLKSSPVARLLDHPGVRILRLDQCMHGAQDELQRPIRKATAFLSNRRWHRTMKRCNGHKGAPHGQLQGQYQGCSRTAMAAVYPKRMCQAMSQDVWSLLRQDSAHRCSPWPRFLFGQMDVLYSCERCQLGRAAPLGCEHTLVPGQCRLGQPNQRAARAKAAAAAPLTPPAAAPSGPSSSSGSAAPPAPASAAPSAPSAAPPMQQTDLEAITGPFKFLARNGDYSRVSLEVHSSLVLSIENRLYLKAALMQLLESCLDVFAADTSRDLRHWLTDPVLLRVFQEVFADVLQVMGVLVCLRPWQRQAPDPHLSSALAPIRLLVQGELRRWIVNPLEDMRLMSHNQIHAAVDEADWHVYVFGTVSDSLPVSGGLGRPAAPLVPAEKKKRWED